MAFFYLLLLSVSSSRATAGSRPAVEQLRAHPVLVSKLSACTLAEVA